MDAEKVLDRHLRLATSGETDQDIRENYSPDVIILATGGDHGTPRRYEGADGVRRSRKELKDSVGEDATFHIQTKMVDGEIGLLRWTAEGDRGRVTDGVDSYLIRDGRIAGQTINYTVKPPEGGNGDGEGGRS